METCLYTSINVYTIEAQLILWKWLKFSNALVKKISKEILQDEHNLLILSAKKNPSKTDNCIPNIVTYDR